MDAGKRTALTIEALTRTKSEVFNIPLYRQMIPWAMRARVHVIHNADNFLELNSVRLD